MGPRLREGYLALFEEPDQERTRHVEEISCLLRGQLLMDGHKRDRIPPYQQMIQKGEARREARRGQGLESSRGVGTLSEHEQRGNWARDRTGDGVETHLDVHLF